MWQKEDVGIVGSVFDQVQKTHRKFSPEVISNTPNRILNTSKVIFVTLEVFFDSLMKSMKFINDSGEIH